MKPPLVVVGPLPPPYHGVTISTSLVLANHHLHERFVVRHVDTSDDRSGQNIGTWDATNIAIAIRSVVRLWRNVRGTAGIVYLPLSQGSAGFVRDSLLIRLAARRGWKVAVHLRGSEFRDFYETRRPHFQNQIRKTLARVTSLAVMGESLRWVFEGLVTKEQVVVVPNGTPEPAVEGQSPDDSLVLFLSNLRLRKGVLAAIETARLVASEHPSARFLFVGEWESEQLEHELKARTGEANGRIAFASPVIGPEKDRLLASAAVLLFPPTEAEGHPRVVLEALAAGTPVVATDSGAIGETIVDGESGFVLPDADPTALAERTLRILCDAELRSRMRVAARQRYRERFTQLQADVTLADWLQSLASQ